MPRESYYLPERVLVSQDDAAIIADPRVPRSKFHNQITHKTTFDAGYLIPFLVDEVLPGDHLSYEVTAYVRLSTPLFPIFDNQRVDTHFFFVPYRILWANFKKFMGEQATPSESIAFTVPQIVLTNGNVDIATLWDYMGLPPFQITGANTISVSALPGRAYNRIWNDWFRDQNLQDSLVVSTGDGPDNPADYAVQQRAKSHDYFTSALPWPQKFTPPTIPLSGLAAVRGLGTDGLGTALPPGNYAITGPATQAFAFPIATNAAGLFWEGTTATGTNPAIYADLSTVTGVAINTFRQAFLVQELLERDARGGTRYTEILRSHFGVVSPDFRLQRPEYIGGGQSPLVITPVAQTAPVAGGTTVGALGAAGTATGQHRASYASTEHGIIIGLISVKSELSYGQGVHRMWRRTTRYNFYWPTLASLGEQEILRQEIYCTGVDGDDDTVFGYQERYHEYRTMYSRVSGMFRSQVPGTLDPWHLAQRFTTPPTLNATFIKDTPPMTRVLAAGSAAVKQMYLADILVQRRAVRPLPVFGTPATLNRF